MSDAPILIIIAVLWTSCVFAALQLWTGGAQRAAGMLAGLLVLGAVIIGMRTGSFGFAWLRSQRLTSDALALGSLAPTVALVVTGAVTHRLRSTLFAVTLAVAGLGAAVSGFAGIAINRSGWYWEFAAVIVGGLTLLVSGVAGATRPDASGNRRLVHGCEAVFGAFLVVAGAVLAAAWRAMA